jgi:ribosomal protein L11 methyltransferase
LGKRWPAIEVQTGSSDLVLALIDDFGPTAIEDNGEHVEHGEHGARLRIFFATADARDAALRAVAPIAPAHAIEVPDEDWARRSQEGLQPVTVGRLTIFPHLAPRTPNPKSLIPNPLSLVILPSMGFGTGHHATTRLCLAALQAMDLTNAVMLDVGTGSGVLAIAADRFGARRAVGIDNDADAIHAARENLTLNPDARNVEFECADVTTYTLPQADVVTANLTGALLVRAAAALLSAVRSGGTLILSGLLADERDEVVGAFAPAIVTWEREEEGWVGVMMKKS